MTNQNQMGSEILDCLGGFVDRHTQNTLAETAAIRDVSADGAGYKATLRMGYPCSLYKEQLAQELINHLLAAGLPQVEFDIDFEIATRSVQGNLKPMTGIKNIIAVASGKGGVGKSTTAVNLALALAAEGASVGLLDADIYGPSVPLMMGLEGRQPQSTDGKTLEPLEAFNVKCMSIGFLVDPEQPMVWRGPMVTSALNQLLSQTNWGELDYLVVDMPPGTGDIQLTLTQTVPVSGSVIVTTPQNIALSDARKGLQMFRKVNVAVLGIVENMSIHICSSCGHEDPVFGSDGGLSLSQQYDAPLLGQLPLDASIRTRVDSGQPSVVSEPESRVSGIYRQVARRMAGELANLSKDYRRLFPNIVVEDS
ncbi:MAG: iron-sulfur cluster carrier protein ApbC [Pseudomonadota bacterium]